jgi:hypothetical protein
MSPKKKSSPDSIEREIKRKPPCGNKEKVSPSTAIQKCPLWKGGGYEGDCNIEHARDS